MPRGRPKKIINEESVPKQNGVVETENKLTEEIASVNLCAGCGQPLNEPQITNEKGSYHGVACYNKVN